MKNVTKKIQIILFAGIIGAMILPFSGMNFADAEKQVIPYTLEEIDHAFTISDGYVTYSSSNRMIVDKQQMVDDGISKKDIKIMKKWARVHNQTMKAMKSNNQEVIDVHYAKVQNGKFKLLVDTSVPEIGGPTGQSHPGQNYWSLTACGITYGFTQHANPPVLAGLSGYSNVTAAQTNLSSLGYTQLPTPYTDADSVGYDYGKINSTGVGGCTGGEFRDQQFIYNYTRTLQPSGQVLESVHTLKQDNEPNPNLAEYNTTTYWWDTYTHFWHLAN